jgi:polar amino acid transport system substrate-binding protein
MRIPFYASSLLAALLICLSVTARAAPPLPPEIASQGVLRVGVKCDYPPSGFLDANRNFAGIEVDMARFLATQAFGSPDKAALQCVTAENRIPALIGKKIDLIIATLGATPERARVIAFSDPYQWGGGDVLVPQNSPIHTLTDLKGHKVVVLKGTTEEAWFTDNMAEVDLLKLNSVADAMQALRAGRVDAYAHDDAVLAQLAAKNPDLRLIGTPYAINVAAIGIRKGDTALQSWVNAELVDMKTVGLFQKSIDKWVQPPLRPLMQKQFLTARPKD